MYVFLFTAVGIRFVIKNILVAASVMNCSASSFIILSMIIKKEK